MVQRCLFFVMGLTACHLVGSLIFMGVTHPRGGDLRFLCCVLMGAPVVISGGVITVNPLGSALPPPTLVVHFDVRDDDSCCLGCGHDELQSHLSPHGLRPRRRLRGIVRDISDRCRSRPTGLR